MTITGYGTASDGEIPVEIAQEKRVNVAALASSSLPWPHRLKICMHAILFRAVERKKLNVFVPVHVFPVQLPLKTLAFHSKTARYRNIVKGERKTLQIVLVLLVFSEHSIPVLSLGTVFVSLSPKIAAHSDLCNGGIITIVHFLFSFLDIDAVCNSSLLRAPTNASYHGTHILIDDKQRLLKVNDACDDGFEVDGPHQALCMKDSVFKLSTLLHVHVSYANCRIASYSICNVLGC